MYLDFDDHPDIPRVPSVISRREAVLLSLVAHLLVIILILLFPKFSPFASRAVVPIARPDQVVRFVQMTPLDDRTAPPKRPAEQSDKDRSSQTREVAPKPENAAPVSHGTNPEKIESTPAERMAGAESPTMAPPSPSPAPSTSVPSSVLSKVALDPVLLSSAPSPGGKLGDSLRNLQRYLRDQNFDNENGGQTQRNADIQFDSKGVDFGPWILRFKAQVERNWFVPESAMLQKGHVVIQFYVLRNGTIVDLHVVEPSGVVAFNSSALTALKLSNPTMTLPAEYPADRVLFTVTFHYNEGIRD
jgi:TonB family protein